MTAIWTDVVTAAGGLLSESPLVLLGPAMLVEGPVATLVAGSLVSGGLLGFWWAWSTALAADLVVDSVLYLVGRSARRTGAVERLRRLGLTESRRDVLSHRVSTGLPRVVLGAKLVDIGAVPAFLAIGLASVPYRRFLAWNLPATAVRAAVLIGLGALAGGQLSGAVRSQPWLVAACGLGLGLVLLAIQTAVRRLAAARGAPHACAS